MRKFVPTERQLERAEAYSLRLIQELKARQGTPRPPKVEARRQRAVMRVLRWAALTGRPLYFHMTPKGHFGE